MARQRRASVADFGASVCSQPRLQAIVACLCVRVCARACMSWISAQDAGSCATVPRDMRVILSRDHTASRAGGGETAPRGWTDM